VEYDIRCTLGRVFFGRMKPRRPHVRVLVDTSTARAHGQFEVPPIDIDTGDR
jgi:hypothetical protein